jgi:hypothetical protein
VGGVLGYRFIECARIFAAVYSPLRVARQSNEYSTTTITPPALIYSRIRRLGKFSRAEADNNLSAQCGVRQAGAAQH